MATKNNQAPSERSRVRFIMVDFDGTSSDMHQLAQTFASAVKAPPQSIVMTPPSAHPNAGPPAIELSQAPINGNGHVHNHQDEPEPEVVAPAVPKQQNGTGKKKLRTPVVISDLEFISGPKPFKTYWQEQSPEQQSKQYLVCMQWLKEHRSITEVGADHIYTLFRAVGTNVPADVSSVLRYLKKQGWAEKGSKPGFFKITHVGEGQLKN